MTRRGFISQGASVIATATVAAAAEPLNGKEVNHVPHTTLHRIEADGVSVFYRAAGPTDAPVILPAARLPHLLVSISQPHPFTRGPLPGHRS